MLMKSAIFRPAFIIIVLFNVILFGCEEKPHEDTPLIPLATKGFLPAPARATNVDNIAGSNFDFVAAAKIVTPAVVHVKTAYSIQADHFFGFGQSIPVRGSGSGVVISKDGYIATNNHVIQDAKEIEVVFPDRRHFVARLVGSDPGTDLALLKVNATDLEYVPFGNSDSAEIGEWVLAVGYPFSLNTTATAGIISAKGRNIGIIASSPAGQNDGGAQMSTAIESFIQTDAAINAGNSGGALVNRKGELIGINTAIASVTGSYAGYAFAVPVNLARKILEDLKDFGSVKRGVLGISYPAPVVEEEFLKQMGISPGTVKGVFITDIQKNSAAETAGLKKGDIIQYIDSFEIFSSAEFSERIARHRPGDKVNIAYLRNGKLYSTDAILKGEESRPLAQKNEKLHDKLGAEFSSLPGALKKRYNIRRGLVVTRVAPGGFFDQLGIPEGTVIVAINGSEVNDVKDLDRSIENSKSATLQILAIAPDGSRIAFNIFLGT